jgi:PAS domain S-box-containing protein
LVELLPFVAPLVVASLGSIALAVVVWRQRDVPGAWWFIIAMVAMALWSVMATLSFAAQDLQAKIVWTNLQYIGVTLVPLAWLLFVLTYTGHAKTLSSWAIVLLSLHPVLTQLLIWTDPHHGLFRQRVWLERVGGVAVMGNQMGAYFWLHVLYSYVLMLIAVYVLVQYHLDRPKIYRRQGAVLLVAAGLPWLANIVTIVAPGALRHVDLTPFAFTLTALAIVVGLLRHEFLDLVPVAREAMIDSLETGIVVLNWEGRVVDLNREAETSLSVSRHTAIGRPLVDLLPHYAYLLSRNRQSEQVQDEITVGENGAAITYDLRVTPLRGRRQQVVGHLIAFQDITARKRAEIKLSRYADRLRTLYEIDQAILVARSAETIATAALDQIQQLLPCKRMSVVTFDAADRPYLLAIRTGEPLSVESALWANGWMRDTIAPLLPRRVNALQLNATAANAVASDNGAPSAAEPMAELEAQLYREGVRSYLLMPLAVQDRLVGALALEDTAAYAFTSEHQDIAAQVAASLAVGLEHARLYTAMQQELAERKLAERALRESEVNLRQKADDLAARNAELDAFAHTVAHDLKTPLSLLLGYASFLEAAEANKRPEDLALAVRAIRQSAWKMNNIIDELLLLSSVRKVADVDRAPLDMAAIVYDVRLRLSDLIDGYAAEIVLPESWPIAWGYAPWIEEVWVNYISNAIKYGGTPPRIELGATVIDRGARDAGKAKRVRFWVRDNGSGLTEAERARLFVPFERLDQTRARGHGLGLSIVQRIMEKLGGVAGIEGSPDGEGSTFYFELPEAQI